MIKFTILILISQFFSSSIKLIESGYDITKYKDIFNVKLELNFANYGDILYNRTIPIKLIVVNDGCVKYSIPNELIANDSIQVLQNNEGSKTCQLSTRTKNAQEAGARGVIFFDSYQGEHSISDQAMLDPNHDLEINIPSSLLDKKYATVIIEQFKSQQKTSMTCLVQFKPITKSKVVNQKIVFNPFDNPSREFFLKWFPVQNLVQRDSIFTPSFFTQFLAEAQLLGFNSRQDTKDCVSGGKFCGMSDNPQISGRDAVMEILKMACLVQSFTDPKDKSKYMIETLSFLYAKCQDSYFSKCMNNQYNAIHKLSAINRCIKNSFSSSDQDIAKNSVLETQREENTKQRVQSFPAIFVNDSQMKGTLDKENLFNQLCTAFETRPEYCNAIITDDDPTHWNVDIATGQYKYDFEDIEMIQDKDDKEGFVGALQRWRRSRKNVIVGVSLLIIMLVGLVYQFGMQQCFKRELDQKIDYNLNRQVEFKDDEEGNKNNIDNWNEERQD